jgi:hypothetical protein
MNLWTIFRITLSNSSSVVDKSPIGRTFWGNFGSLLGFGNVIIFASFQDFGKWGSWKQWLNKCVRYASGLLGRCLSHSFGIPWSPPSFLNMNKLSIYVHHKVLLFPSGCRLQIRAELGFYSPPVAHDFRHRSHEMWTGFLNNPQWRWLSHPSDMLFLKDHEQRLVPLVHLFICDIAIGHRTWGVISQFATFLFHLSSAFLRLIRLMVLVTQCTAILHAGSQVTCHRFLNLRLRFSRLSTPGRSL